VRLRSPTKGKAPAARFSMAFQSMKLYKFLMKGKEEAGLIAWGKKSQGDDDSCYHIRFAV